MTIKQYFNTYFFNILFKHYGDCKGREGRKIFSLFILNCIIIVGISLLISLGIGSIVAFLLLLPFMTIIVRRLQDINLDGWWLFTPWMISYPFRILLKNINLDGWWISFFAMFIYIGFLILLFCIPGTKGENKYGMPPNN